MGLVTTSLGSWREMTLQQTHRSYMGVSENNGTPKSSILIGISIINHPFWGTTISGNVCSTFESTFDGQFYGWKRLKKLTLLSRFPSWNDTMTTVEAKEWTRNHLLQPFGCSTRRVQVWKPQKKTGKTMVFHDRNCIFSNIMAQVHGSLKRCFLVLRWSAQELYRPPKFCKFDGCAPVSERNPSQDLYLSFLHGSRLRDCQSKRRPSEKQQSKSPWLLQINPQRYTNHLVIAGNQRTSVHCFHGIGFPSILRLVVLDWKKRLKSFGHIWYVLWNVFWFSPLK